MLIQPQKCDPAREYKSNSRANLQVQNHFICVRTMASKNAIRRSGKYKPIPFTKPAVSTSSGVSVPKENRDSSSVIAYVHNLSPMKRNRKNTVNYFTVVLQTKNETVDALLYSATKRQMLQDCANSHTPVKLQRFTKTTEGDKLIINDMVKITIPDQSEYCFQFKSMEQLVKMVTIKEILDLSDEWQIVSLCAKAIHIGETTVAGVKRLNLAQATFADVTGSILIDLWEDQIKLVEPGSVSGSNLQVRV